MIEPEVSVPMVSAESAAAPAAPEPEDEPLGFWSASTALSTWPVRFENPDGWLPKKLAYSERPSLPRITTPFSRSFLATPESIAGKELRSEKLPADVYIPFTSIRSLSRIGRPWAGPRTWPSLRSLSSGRGVLERVLVELRDGVDARPALVERGDPRDVRAGELDRRELAFVHQLDGGRAVERLQVQLCGGRGCGRDRSEHERERYQPPGGRCEFHLLTSLRVR